MTLLYIVAGNDNDYLALWFLLREVAYELGKSAAYCLLVHFGYLTADAGLSLRSEKLGKLL